MTLKKKVFILGAITLCVISVAHIEDDGSHEDSIVICVETAIINQGVSGTLFEVASV